ncbi:hypothetical protein ABT061_45050 [Streptosporangium sp. NPDC002544]|uniref:hypothetical protein n=1 Tax=Streptosporangium sp. NPDC002544 TaxID=3154538 RepID=UPI0033341E87
MRNLRTAAWCAGRPQHHRRLGELDRLVQGGGVVVFLISKPSQGGQLGQRPGELGGSSARLRQGVLERLGGVVEIRLPLVQDVPDAQHAAEGDKEAGERVRYRTLCAQGSFRAIDAPTFAALLRDLGAGRLIRQESDGLLLHAEVGERLVNHHTFHAAFAAPTEYHIVTAGRTNTRQPSPGELPVRGGAAHLRRPPPASPTPPTWRA